MSERFKIGDIDNERYYVFPKSLLSNPAYSEMTLSSKVIYMVLKDRMELSRKNGWVDDNGDVFFLFKQESIADEVKLSLRTVASSMKELKDFGLIDTVRQGLNKPNKLYLNKLPLLQNITCEKCTFDNADNALPTMQNMHTNEPNINEPNISEPKSLEVAPKNSSSKAKKSTKKQFVPPTIEEVREYAREKAPNVDADYFYNYFTEGNWTDAKGNKVISWKQKMLTWNKYSNDNKPKEQQQEFKRKIVYAN